MRTFSFLVTSAFVMAGVSLGYGAQDAAPDPRSEIAPRATLSATAPKPSDESAALLRSIGRIAAPDATARALEASMRRLRVQPENSDQWTNLGDIVLQLSRDTADPALYASIERIYAHAWALDPRNADALVGLAWAAGAAHRFAESVERANDALTINPDLPAAYGILGDAAVELGRYDEAATHYQKMLDLRPDMGSYSRSAHLLYLRGNATRAIALMRRAISVGGSQPEHTAWCVAALSRMLCNEGVAPSAVKLVEASLAHAPDNVTLLAAVGHARMAMQDDAGAIAALERANALRPQHATLVELHDLYLANDRAADADRIAREVETLHRTLREQGVLGGEGSLARFYADRGEKTAEAVVLAESEYSHHRGPVAADTLAWAYFRAGRIPEAAKLLPEVLKYRVSDPAMLYHAGLIEEAAGNPTVARQHLYEALSRAPRFHPLEAVHAAAALQRLGSRSGST